MDRPEQYAVEATLGDPEVDGEPKKERLVYGRDIGETEATAPDTLRTENEMPVYRTERSEDTGALVDKPTKVAKRVTVGKGAKGRATAAAVAEEPEDVKFNKSA